MVRGGGWREKISNLGRRGNIVWNAGCCLENKHAYYENGELTLFKVNVCNIKTSERAKSSPPGK